MTLEKIKLQPRPRAKRFSSKKYEKVEYAVIVADKAFVGLVGGKSVFSEDWSKAKTFDDERKFDFFSRNFKDPVKIVL